MRRVSVFLAMLLALTAIVATRQAVSAQTAVPPFGPAVTPGVSPDIVVARLMTFDRDHDGRLVRSELPERMQNLLAADTSGDHALDRDEIRAIARPVPPPAVAATVPGFAGGGGGGYAFGDQVSLSTRAHVEGALEDLRLTPIQHQQALAIVRPFMDSLEADASDALMKELEGLMPPRQHATFKTMLERQLAGNVGPMVMRQDGVRVNVFRFGPDLTMMIKSFQLGPEQMSLALAAFDAFKVRIRPADADRAVLLKALKKVLSDEERENFDAALQRRPLVKANAMFAGVVSGVMPPPVPPPPPFPLREFRGDVRGPADLQLRVLEP